MRQDFFEYVPQFKLIVAGNHKPGLRNVDKAIRRRLHLVPFTVTIGEQEQDPNLASKLKAEYPGILQWAIKGCVAWTERGLDPPVSVRDATEGYLAAEDVVGRLRSAAWAGGNTGQLELPSTPIFKCGVKAPENEPARKNALAKLLKIAVLFQKEPGKHGALLELAYWRM
jgi:hypothetical protein